MTDNSKFTQPGVVILNKNIHMDEYTSVSHSHWVIFGATRDGMSAVRPQDKPQTVTEGKSDD